MKITKAVLPAAGLGTRFLPATKAQPKEMLPIVDKPCIHYIVEEAVNSGITDIIIITGRNKRAIEDYFDNSSELKFQLEKSGKIDVIESLERIEKMANFYFVRQDRPLGDGHAILCAKELVKNEPFAVLFGDDIFDSKTPALAQMIQRYEELNAPVIAALEVKKSQVNKYGIMGGKKHNDMIKINKLVEKPNPKDAPSNFAISGKYIVTPKLLKTLEQVRKNDESEIKLIDGMEEYIKTSPIYGLKIQGERFDTGDKLGYLKSVVHFALKDPKLNREFKDYLKNLNLN